MLLVTRETIVCSDLFEQDDLCRVFELRFGMRVF